MSDNSTPDNRPLTITIGPLLPVAEYDPEVDALMKECVETYIAQVRYAQEIRMGLTSIDWPRLYRAIIMAGMLGGDRQVGHLLALGAEIGDTEQEGKG